MADIPTRQVTIYLSIKTRAKVPTIKGWLEGGLISELGKLDWAEGEGCEFQQVWVGEAAIASNRQKHFDQLSKTVDHVLAELEDLVDEGIVEVQDLYETIEEMVEGLKNETN